MANEKYGFIIHPEEWRMARDVLPPKEIADALFPVLDACLAADDPSEAIGDIINTNLCARMFWDRNVRDIDRYETNLKASNERKRRFRELKKRNGTERDGTDGNAEEREGTPRNGGNGHYTDTDTKPNTNTNTNSNINRTESVSDTDRQEGSEPESESVDVRQRVKASGRLKADPWNMPTDEILYGRLSTTTILHQAFGKGGWRQAVDQAGEDAVKDLFLIFRSELRSGEMPSNPAAAFTARLAKDLGVKFKNDSKGQRQ